MECSIVGRGGRYAIAVSGDVDLTSTDQLRLAIRGVADGITCGSVVVDLSETSFIDVHGVNALVAAAVELRQAGMILRVEQAGDATAELIRRLGVAELLMPAAADEAHRWP
jgi:anti-anti-sigma factor